MMSRQDQATGRAGLAVAAVALAALWGGPAAARPLPNPPPGTATATAQALKACPAADSDDSDSSDDSGNAATSDDSGSAPGPDGYIAIPGSSTCLKISGYVYYEFWLLGSDAASLQPGWYSASRNGISTSVNADLAFSTKTATELGAISTTLEMRVNKQGLGGGEIVKVPSGVGNSWQLYTGMVEWGGLTAGYTQSMFDFYTGSTYASLYEPAWSDTRTNIVAYTYSPGDGNLSFTGSLEDSAARNVAIAGTPVTGSGYAGQQVPDVVGQLAYSDDWGSAQAAAASHLVNTFLYPDETLGYAAKVGWAAAGGLTLNLPELGDGDSVTLQGAYGDGALSYVAVNPRDDHIRIAGADARIVTAADGTRSLDLGRAWSVSGGITHNWSPLWQTNINLSYLDVGNLGPENDFRNIDVQANQVFFPVENLQFGVEVEYKRIEPAEGSLGNALVALLHIERDF